MNAFFFPGPSLPREQRLKTSYGFRTRSSRKSRGWLILTGDGRLIFERSVPWLSYVRLFPSPNFNVDLRDIKSVHRLAGDAFDFSPFVSVLCVTLTSGEQLFVQLQFVSDWLDALGDAIGLTPVKRTEDAPTQS
jgi:hypothetical protein